MFIKYQYFIVSKVVITRSYDFFSRFQPFKDFVELRILTSYAYFTFNSFSAFRRHDIYPFACSLLVECAAMDKYRFFRLSKLQIQVIGLAGPDVVWLLAAEPEVCLELAVTYLRVYFAYDGVEGLVLPFECSTQTC